MKVPTYTNQENIQPAKQDPKLAANLGNMVVDVGSGLEGMGEAVQKLDDKRQTLKAETYLAKQHLQIQQMAATDPDLDTLDERVNSMSEDGVSQAADLIKSGEARQDFISKANLDIERRNSSVYNTIIRRKSQDFKNQLVQANDADVTDYQASANPQERQLIKQRIQDRTNDAINDGHVNAQWAQQHVKTLLKSADINQVSSDMAIDPTHTYEQLQKGSEGLYPDLTAAQRKQFADKAQKMIEKQGSDNKLIYGIAQNHAENQLIDKMANNTLTQADISQMATIGSKGIRPRPEFIKAATEAMQDPFPTDSVPDKYNKLVDQIQETSTPVDPIKLKLDVLTSRGLSLEQKAHLINAHLREDPEEGKTSISQMINEGIKQNKEKLMEADKALKAEQTDRQGLLRRITDRFRDHAKDDAHLAQLQQNFMEANQNVKDDKERINLAQEIMNKDTLKRNPGIATSDVKGTVFIDKTTGAKRRYFPSGMWEPIKGTEDE